MPDALRPTRPTVPDRVARRRPRGQVDRALGRRGHLPLRPPRPRATRSTRSTRRRRRSRARCTSATSSATRTPTSSRATGACAARRSSTRWAGTTTAWPPSAASRTSSGSAATPTLAYDHVLRAPGDARQGEGRDLAAQLRRALPAPHDPRRGVLQARLSYPGLVDRLDAGVHDGLGARPRRQPARVPRVARARRGLLRGRAHALGRRLPHRRSPRPSWTTASARATTTGCAFARADGDGTVEIETTRPELLASCVALVAHPDDARYRALFGTTVVDAALPVRVPVRRPRAGRPREGHGHRDDLHVRRHHRRHVVARARRCRCAR